MPTPVEKKKLVAICAKLRENDPTATVLDLSAYGALGWTEAEILCDSLEGNTCLSELTLDSGKDGISADGLLLLIPFLRTCPSLRKFRFRVTGDVNGSHQDAASAILNTISYTKSLTEISLVHIRYERPEVLEKLLSKTVTLKQLEFSDNGDSNHFLQVCQSLRLGFQQNETLETITFTSKRGPHIEEALFGMFNLPKLTNLTLNVVLTNSVAQVLRCFFNSNETLHTLNLTLRYDEESLLAPVLGGIAHNRGIKDIQLFALAAVQKCAAAAWTELFHENHTIQSFRLVCGERSVDRASVTAIAEGLCGNVSLQKLFLADALVQGAFDGAAWGVMIQKNHALIELDLGGCDLGHGGEGAAAFKLFTIGLSRNTSLKKFDLNGNYIGNAGGDALADALQGNETLEDLRIEQNDMEGQEGQAVIGKLWSSTGLQYFDVSNNPLGGSGCAFAGGLPKNETLKHVDFSGCQLDSEECRTILESLNGNCVLQVLVLNNNNVTLDGSCAAALTSLLECGRAPLRKLDLQGCQVTSDGMTQLTECLKSNTSLTHLDLKSCGVENDGLLQLAEALVENTTLAEVALHENPFGDDALCRFFQLLPQMKGLKSLRLNTSLLREALGLELVKGLLGRPNGLPLWVGL